nr:hypothetical protein [Providencia stuartii]ELR5082971.1 hypothetical protein [Providencia stuartii]
MGRDDILERIVYSHYLEKIYSTALGRLDKLISVLLLISGSAVIIKWNPVLFGVLIAALAAIQSTYQFGKKSGESNRKAFDYQKLYTIEAKYDDADLMDRMLELENSDSKTWSWLEPIAILKTQIRLGVPKEEQKELNWKTKLLRILCG